MIEGRLKTMIQVLYAMNLLQKYRGFNNADSFAR